MVARNIQEVLQAAQLQDEPSKCAYRARACRVQGREPAQHSQRRDPCVDCRHLAFGRTEHFSGGSQALLVP